MQLRYAIDFSFLIWVGNQKQQVFEESFNHERKDKNKQKLGKNDVGNKNMQAKEETSSKYS